MKNLPILQSGFLANTDIGLIKSTETNLTREIKYLILTSSVRDKFNPYFYDPDIERIYNKFMTKNSLIRNFEYRELILIKAIQLFGNMPFNWFKSQSKSPIFTHKHYRFLVDTLNYIRTGNRHLGITTWISIIKPEGVKDDPDEYDKYMLSLANDPILSNLPEMLSAWTSNIDGFLDLLLTMKIIFGVNVQKEMI